MKSTMLVTVLVAIVGRFMADEVKAWVAWLHDKLRRAAVSMLPKKYRERYDEEWESGLEECPGEIFKLIYSIGLLVAAAGIRKAARDSFGLPAIKRFFDIVFASSAIILLAPLIVAIAVAIRLETPGPVYQSSKRIGKKGRAFPLITFRTTTLDGRHEPRFTRVGRLLNKFSLNEIPQFFNVLQGHMSIVGPRSITSEAGEHKRLECNPGMTGLWQEFGGRIGRDLIDDAYVKNWSLWLDFKIIVRALATASWIPLSKPRQHQYPPDENRD
jgi:lipopolysaccharide/colanic/teichoic acid biosynthesis glycosyltransferase